MRLEQKYKFEAAHMLPFVPDVHKCGRMHGHSYVVVVAVEGPVDPGPGWVMDFAEIDAAVRPVIARLDHRTLNVIAGLDNPTSENLAWWLWDALRPSLPMLAEVAVSETTSSRVVYRGEQ
jgi:6-pyruvoyltetrahydropterin/6-carboxytetrahydropterin synthase